MTARHECRARRIRVILAKSQFLYFFSVAAWPATGISNTGTYTISWNTANNATDYELEEDTSASFGSAVQLYQGPNTSLQITGRANGTYYYRVRGINTTYNTQGAYRAGYNAHDVDTTVGTVPGIPAAPTNVSVPTSTFSTAIRRSSSPGSTSGNPRSITPSNRRTSAPPNSKPGGR